MIEIEFKYPAEEINFSDFEKFCKEKNPNKIILVSGQDHFYCKDSDSTSFCRHRLGVDMNQLTFKRKLNDDNNFIRVEKNIDLAMNTKPELIEALCNEFNYKYNFSLFKTSYVYTYDWYTLVYYICYDKDLKELGRFIEIEMNEDYDWPSEEEAFSQLVIVEKLCKSLGLKKTNRVKPSLFELYKR